LILNAMTSILVTGGAGYVGSHVCKALAAAGYTPVVYDNLSRGHREFAKWGPFEFGDVRDGERLDRVIEAHRPSATVHLAALAYVAESVADPLAYYDNNVGGSLILLKALIRGGIGPIVFSSTCAVYGSPAAVPIGEQAELRPINPYGETKLAVERMIAAAASAGHVRFAVLRYFNAAGADPDGDIGERHDPEPHLIPSVIMRVLSGEAVPVYGKDYPTPDGTCVRDYVSVVDLADAHVRAVRHLLNGKGNETLNLGTGHGFSVLEIVEQVGALVGRRPAINFLSRRPGDPSRLVAHAQSARMCLDWWPRNSDLKTVLSSAISWHRGERP
jgi:UDP-glucose-4-epimerase GalE